MTKGSLSTFLPWMSICSLISPLESLSFGEGLLDIGRYLKLQGVPMCMWGVGNHVASIPSNTQSTKPHCAHKTPTDAEENRNAVCSEYYTCIIVSSGAVWAIACASKKEAAMEINLILQKRWSGSHHECEMRRKLDWGEDLRHKLQ